MWNLKGNDTNKLPYKIDSQTLRTHLGLPEGRVRGRDGEGVWDGRVHTLLYLKWITNKERL